MVLDVIIILGKTVTPMFFIHIFSNISVRNEKPVNKHRDSIFDISCKCVGYSGEHGHKHDGGT